MNTTNNKVELYTDTFDEFSCTEIKEELEDILDISNITSKRLQNEEIAPVIISTYRKPQTEKRMTDGYYMLLLVMLDHHFKILKIDLEL